MVQFDGNVFIVLKILTVVFCGAAFLTGQALANNWLPAWWAVPYGLMLTIGARFLGFALFEGRLLSVGGFVIDAIILIAVILIARRVIQARKMVSQYPWLYESAGPFGWRERGQGHQGR